MTPAIALKEVTRIFSSRFALRKINLTVSQGEALLITGHNGSGKTTLLRLISTLLSPSSGQLQLFGQDPLLNRQTIRRRMGVLLTESLLYGDLTVRENLHFYGSLLRVLDLKRVIQRLLERFEISDLADEPVRHLSKGEKQRVALIRSLLHEPDLLLWDEPTSGLDDAGRTLFQEVAAEFRGKKTLVCVTHDRPSFTTWVDREIVLERGRVQ